MIKYYLHILLGIFISTPLSAQEPINQPTNFVSSNIKPYSFNIGFTGSASDGYIVFRSTTPFIATPVDGTEYQKGGGIANAKIFSVSSATFAQIKEVSANTTYYFTIFAYNGSGASIDYLQSNPLTATVSTPDNQIGNYYLGIDQNASGFISDLHNLLQSTHTHIDYYDYDDNIIPAVFERDTVGGKKLVECEYSGLVTQYYAPFSFTATDFSREHCLARSWMPSDATTDDPEAADYHNLLLTNLSNANTPRSNHPVGEVITPTYTFMDCKVGYDSLGGIVFEPAEHIKGDVARAMFYEMVAWDGTGGSNWAIANLAAVGPNQDVDVLLDWHFADPPSGPEKAKSEYIYFLQGNRNPFTDYPDWVNCINWYQLIRFPGCYTTVGTENETSMNIRVYPNPAQGHININADYIAESTTVSLIEMNGRIIKKIRINQQLTNNPFSIDLSDVYCGVFLLKIESDKEIFIQKIIVQN